MNIVDVAKPWSRFRSLLVAVFISIAGLSALAADGDKPKPKPVILVPPFENQSKQHQNIGYEVGTGSDANHPKRKFVVDRFTEVPRSLIEDMLTNMQGVTVVERQRIDALLVESEFGSLSGLVDSEKAVKLGKLAGANLIVMGTITSLSDEPRKFNGYGVKTEVNDVTCEVRVRLLDMESGNIRFSKTVTGSKQYAKSSYGGTSSSDRFYAAIKAASAKLGEDPQFLAAIKGDKATSASADGMIEVDFSPKPDNCDIEIDGKYLGGSPMKRKLKAGGEYKVRISKGGYQSWEGVISPEAGLKITRELPPSR